VTEARRGPRDSEVRAVDRTDAHDPLPREEAEDLPLPPEPDGDESVLIESVDDSLAGQWLRSLDALESRPPEEVNDRTAAYDPPSELFGAVPDPEDLPIPASSAPRVVVLPPPEAAPEPPPEAAPEPPPEPEPAPEPPPPARPVDVHLPDKSTAFLPVVSIDPALARRMRPPTRRNVVPAALRAPSRPTPPPTPPPIPEPEEDDIPSVVYAPEPPRPDEMDRELTGIYEPPKVVELPRGRLVIVAGENVGKAYYLNRAQVTVGRGNDNDVVLLDIAVSRRHLRIERHAEGFRLVDLQSGNGTVVNGRRTTEAELYDGDRVEVGNSLIDFSTVGTPRRRQEQPPATDPGARVTPAVAVKASGRSVPLTWLLLWFGTTLAAVLMGVFVARLVAGAPKADDVPVKQKATAAYDRAAEAMRGKDWQRAEEELKVARQLAPDLFDYTTDLGRIEHARGDQRQLAEARKLLGEAHPDDVRALVKGIAADSPYHGEAEALVAEAGRRWLDHQVERAEALQKDGKAAAARAIAEEVLAQDAANVRARALVDGAAAPEAPPSEAPAPPSAALAPSEAPAPPSAAAAPSSTAPPRPAAPSDADRRVRSDLLDAGRLYREEKFNDAQALLDHAAARAEDRGLARKARDRSHQIGAFATAWTAAGSAVRARRTDDAIEAFERALGVDAQLGGAFRDRIRGQLADQQYLRAIREFSRQNYDQARAANDRVLELSPGHPLGTKLAEKMTRTADDLLRKARDTRSSDPERARNLARQAQALTHRNDATWKDARDLVQSLN
jgi:pSer/pThr/pTyr-binding forkhead associated (FHA) protein/tetratricopeptide (TPR) repeat protein